MTAKIAHSIEHSFEFFPASHEPAGAMRATASTDQRAGFDQGFDAETGQTEPKPIFRFRW